jgi:hypothetical protein
MNRYAWMALCGGLALSVACGPRQDTETKKVETETETTRGGEEVKSKTEVEQETARGTVEMEKETHLGTVTDYQPGESIELKAEDGRTHEIDLDQQDARVDVDPNVRVGSKVEVSVERRDGKATKISVLLHA